MTVLCGGYNFGRILGRRQCFDSGVKSNILALLGQDSVYI